jgi:cyanate permease
MDTRYWVAFGCAGRIMLAHSHTQYYVHIFFTKAKHLTFPFSLHLLLKRTHHTQESPCSNPPACIDNGQMFFSHYPEQAVMDTRYWVAFGCAGRIMLAHSHTQYYVHIFFTKAKHLTFPFSLHLLLKRTHHTQESPFPHSLILFLSSSSLILPSQHCRGLHNFKI